MTEKQKKFVEEYLIDLNAAQAAIRAGYKCGSVQRASEIGSQLLRKAPVAEAINAALADRSKRTGITQDRVLRELARLAFVNAADVIDPETGGVRPDASRDDLACIQSVKVKETRGRNPGIEREVKLCDKKAALELLGKHLGMFRDKVEVSGSLETEKTKLDDLIQQMRGDPPHE